MQYTKSSLAGTSYIPALDGFRGIAILLVVISHYGVGHLLPGGFGVTLFFFISGFLITRLLIAEYTERQTIDLRGFYFRRLLRLYPALLVMVVLAVGFTWAMGCGFQVGEIVSTLFYYRNYYMLYGHADAVANCTRIFDITWSLAIEEHFYLFFPLLFLALYRRPNILAAAMAAIIVGVLIWRLRIMATDGLSELTVHRIYHLTDTRLDAIMFGCFVSLAVHQKWANRYLTCVGHPVVFAAAIGLLLFTFIYRDGAFRETWRYSFQGLALSVILPAILYESRYGTLTFWLSKPRLVLIGKLSYSLYLFHWIGLCVAENLIGGERLTLSWLLTAVPLGLTLSLLSYHYVEKPTARLRKRFGSTVETTVVGPKSAQVQVGKQASTPAVN